MVGKLSGEHILESAVRLLPSIPLGRAHTQVDGGVRGEVLPVGAAAHLPNISPFEQAGVGQPRRRRLELGLHHGHVERFAKAARTAEQGCGVAGIEHVDDKGSLVD